ncbi:hypothetical protein Tco_1449415 [Tanacetum coccineum]
MFDELLTTPPSVDYPAPEDVAPIHEVVAPVPAVSTGTTSSTTVDQDAPSPSNSQRTPETQSPIIPNDVDINNDDIEVAHMYNDSFFGVPILEVPFDQSPSTDIIHTILHCQPGTNDTLAVPERTVPETFLNISPENKAHYDAEAEAIHLILTGIGDDIYSTVDACTIAKDMGIAIERLQQGESLNKQDVKTNPFLEFGEFTSRDRESIVSYYSRFYTMMNEMVINQLEVATMQENVRFLQQLQPEWHFAKECKKPKRVKDYTYHKEKMLFCKQAEKGVPLCSKQADWQDDTDEELDEQELEAHYNFMAKIQVVITVESGPTFDAEPLEHVDQNAEECDDERAVLANLIANLKLDTDENKKIQKQLKKTNTSLSHELIECKSALEECKSSLEESNRTPDRYLGALHDLEVELVKYKRFNVCTLENDRLERKFKETLKLFAQKEIDSKEVLKTKGYEIFVEKEKNNELVKQRSLTTSRYESLIKEENKVIQDFKTRQEKDIEK